MKNNLTAIIVDDEMKALSMLELKLNKIFPQISILGKFNEPLQAIEAINVLRPQILFLDISMPGYDGFELLKHILTPSFELIFVTAHNNYALDAFRNAAIGYILKPIDDAELKNVTLLAMNNIHLKMRRNKEDIKLGMISIPINNGFIIKPVGDIIRCEGFDGYTKIFLKDDVITSSYNIGFFNKMLLEYHFRMVHKSHLVNLEHIEKYLNEGTLVLMNKDQVPVSRSYRNELLQLLKNGY